MSKLPDHSFTSKAPSSTRFQRCERTACGRVYGMEVNFDFVSGPPGTPGRMVCPDCAVHYRRKRGQEEGQTPVPAQQHEFTQTPDQQLIAANSASRRGRSSLPVARFPNSRSSSSAGPSNVQFAAVPSSATSSEYLAYRARMASAAAATSSLQRPVVMAFSLHTFKEEGKSGTVLVGNVARDAQASHAITNRNLFIKAVDVLRPLFEDWAPGYPFPENEVVLYKSPLLPLYDPRLPAAADADLSGLEQFYFTASANKRNGEPGALKYTPSKSLKILLVMKHQKYLDIVEWISQDPKSEDELESEEPTLDVPQLFEERIDRALGIIPGQDATSKKHRRHSSTPSALASPQAKVSRRNNENPRQQNDVPDRSGNRPSAHDSTPVLREKGKEKTVSAARIRETEPSSSSSSTARNTIAPPPLTAPAGQLASRATQSIFSRFKVPQKLHDVLSRQDEVGLQADTYFLEPDDVFIYPVHVVGFRDLVENKPLAVDIALTTSPHRFSCKLFVSKQEIGSPGGFKTCHDARITLNHGSSASDISSTILTSPSIVAKRCFIRKPSHSSHLSSTSSLPFRKARMKTADELPRLLTEANLSFWGSALMTYCYEFVAQIEQGKNKKIPIPRLRFVMTALAMHSTNKEAPPYLLEERIPGQFTKYILNNSLKPMAKLDEGARNIALFLCSMQHLQYFLTDGEVILSDYQGDETLLTDCQVITTSEYATKFGAGNLSEVLESFEVAHTCNHYCTYFDLPLLPSTADPAISQTSNMSLGTQY